MALPLALMIGGKALQGYANFKSLLDQADSLYASASMDKLQGMEIRYRADINKKAFEKESQKLIAEQQGMYAGAGVAVSEGAPLSTMLDTVDSVVERLNNMEREASYSAMIKDMESESKFKKGKQATSAAYLSLLGMGADIGKSFSN